MDVIFKNTFKTPTEKLKFILLATVGIGIGSFISTSWANSFQSIVDAYKKSQAKPIDDVTFSFMISTLSTIIVIVLGYIIFILNKDK